MITVDKSEIRIRGVEPILLAELATIIERLNKIFTESGTTHERSHEQIIKAVSLGLMSDEELLNAVSEKTKTFN